DQARSRTYRWGEDGIAGISDDRQLLCFALALWNGNDPILKERLFGLTGSEGNHGEDVKEYYFYLDNTPTHSYMKMLYKYPQVAFPYEQLVLGNRGRSKYTTEFELLDTGVFDDDRYFDVVIEYAKAGIDDILVQITAINRGPEAATLHLLPTLWFRNTWSWEHDAVKPVIKGVAIGKLEAYHPHLGSQYLYFSGARDALFTDNETNHRRIFNVDSEAPYCKDGINDFVVNGKQDAINPHYVGTKAAPHYVLTIAAGASQVVKLRLTPHHSLGDALGAEFDQMIQRRLAEADEFYQKVAPLSLNEDQRAVQRQAFAGMLWTKQWFYYDVERWLTGDPAIATTPPPERMNGRNRLWTHLNAHDIISMPDKWEYPWFAAWDLAFHTIPLALIDPDFAKHQLDLITRERYLHPNGQLPAYEWNFGDVNPPVHAWATWRVYQLEQQYHGRCDRAFLERVFHKLLLNFTWWVNRKDIGDNNVFQGGFLGLDNIGIFDRSAPLPTGGFLDQADGTSWMAMYALNMFTIAVELAQDNPNYEDLAIKFLEHFVYIAAAMDKIGIHNDELWDEQDGFFYDVLQLPNGSSMRLKVRSMVGLIPLFATTTVSIEQLKSLPNLRNSIDHFMTRKPNLRKNIFVTKPETARLGIVAIVNPDKLRRILQRMLDPNEFLSDHGIRALSRVHREHPFVFSVGRDQFRVDYEPAESTTGMFGGNSNWRGPVWMPVNYLLIESLQTFHRYLGQDFTVEYPTGSGNWLTLEQVAAALSDRLVRIFLRNDSGYRPVYGGPTSKFQTDDHWRNWILFYEYFHGDNGAGIGASHQTGWTGLVADLLQQYG
ncbi:MAG: glucosidase, partial [Cyanobacteria bacterium]|nr:glucosidase [Cyanobacteriota bacterium]MDW8202006.1 glucosidase [Cyanobacteriota bacterium SKYGB_h_bin112]